MIVYIEGRTITIKEPREVTLKKYGLSLNDWKVILTDQDYRCPICTRPLEKTTNIDHFHAKNWKKMSPERRKLFVRGVTCWWCNKSFLSKGITPEKARNLYEYIVRFEKRKPK